ncbi:cupin domain-containing protein [Halomicroarcula sp. F28]|uniref:cupin domain-containing protein n=1 Tax=Haloarcula salinisoli TaxID=2487746 RepID=UPI001C731633|nr:cupin domain-containing protein [Halomicroarcula salinisoli]MBX0286827.1 cupin domain-containing protein [Halomicroarcula salinisoli]
MGSEPRSRDGGQRIDDGGERTLRTGRPLVDGTPVDGPALDVHPERPASVLLRQSPHPLVSDPASETWATLLERPEQGETDRPVLLQWVSPASPAPPPHSHPTTETFRTLEGTLTVVCDGDPVRLGPGESLTVEAGQAHTFRNDTDETVAFRAKLPSMRTVTGLYTAWGLAHERGRDDDGSYPGPGLLHSLAIAADLYDETAMAMAPQPAQRLLWAVVGRVASLSGVTGIDEAYLDPSFWTRHVEQPAWEP